VHERALIADVVRAVEEAVHAAGATRVTAVAVRLGALSHFTPEHFRQHFDDAARGTIAEGAEVHASVEPALDDPRARDVVLERLEVE